MKKTVAWLGSHVVLAACGCGPGLTSDVRMVEGVPTTRVRRAIEDCHRTHLGPALLRQAIEDGEREGYLRPDDARELERLDMILGGRLEEVGSSARGPRFIIKGAVALEMRLALKARATRGIDLVVDEAGREDLAGVPGNALTDDYQGFTFRMNGEPYVMPNEAVRVEVAMDYQGRSRSTVQLDLSKREGDATETELCVELAAGLGLAEKTLGDAVREAQAFIQDMDAAGTQ